MSKKNDGSLGPEEVKRLHRRIKTLEKRVTVLQGALKSAESSGDQWQKAYDYQFKAQQEARELEEFYSDLLRELLTSHHEVHTLNVDRGVADALEPLIAGRVLSLEDSRALLEVARESSKEPL